ncbi:TonB system transport protein ExbD [Hahella sp. CR1]|uniref:TonB system transport protein ExbD n=1 Tax=Hahella sp. CR1 TaxID=2992807 RepID=UPI002441F9CF|nr:TonB system transport protein ExbD [Hahella sp. CR1]MDG9666564.1 TonB system transport protein ExbD [Hahella sp. CR1]
MKKFDQINVIPFIDIMLVLLAIVLTTATFVVQGKIPIELPSAENVSNKSAPEHAVNIVIDKENLYYYQDEAASLEQLENRLKALGKSSPITLKVDSQADFKSFVAVADLLQKYSLTNFSVLASRNQ